MQVRFELAFERFRDRYHGMLHRCLHYRRAFLLGFVDCLRGLVRAAGAVAGAGFFPQGGRRAIQAAPRARAGTRIEETANLCDRVEGFIREQIPPSEISSIIDNIGLPYSGINLSYSNSAPTGPADADIMVALTPEHRPTEEYVHDLRLKLADAISRRGFLLSACRHRQPDFELRFAFPD